MSARIDPTGGLGYDIYALVATPERRASDVVADAMGYADSRGLEALLYTAFDSTVRVSADQVEATLITPDATIVVDPVPGTGREQAEELVERLMSTARGLLPARYLDWHTARATMTPEEPLREAPSVSTLDEVLELLHERLGAVMTAPVITRDPHTDGDIVQVRLYDTFDLSTGLDRPYGFCFRTVTTPAGHYIHALPGEGSSLRTTPASIRRAYDVVDQYCRARLDLPPRP